MNYDQRVRHLQRQQKAVYRALARHGYTQREMAEELKIPHSTVHKWLAGKRAMSSDRLFQIAEWVGLETAVE